MKKFISSLEFDSSHRRSNTKHLFSCRYLIYFSRGLPMHPRFDCRYVSGKHRKRWRNYLWEHGTRL